MAFFKIKDAQSVVQSFLASGAGSEGDPYVPTHYDTIAHAKLDSVVTALGNLLSELQQKAENLIAVTDNNGSLTVDGPLTNTELRASPLSIVGSMELDVATDEDKHLQVDVLTMPAGGGGLTNTELRASPVPVSDGGGSITVDGTVSTGLSQPLTDTQLRATAVPVSVASVPSHPVTNAGTFVTQENGAALTSLQLIDDAIHSAGGTISKAVLIGGKEVGPGTFNPVLLDNGKLIISDGSGSITVDGPITDAQLRASAVPVTGPVTNTQLRAMPLPVSDGDGSITVDGQVDIGGDVGYWVEEINIQAMNVGTAIHTRDGASQSTDNGALILGVRNDANAALTNANLDFSPIAVDASGRLKLAEVSGTMDVNVLGFEAGYAPVQISAYDDNLGEQTTIRAWDGAMEVYVPLGINVNSIPSTATHDQGASSYVDTIGAEARSSERAAVANADAVRLIADLVGKLIVLPYANPENFVSGATSDITGTTPTSVIAAQGSGVRNYITQILVTNSSATVGTFVNITDGSGGTVLYTGYAAPGGGGFSINLPVPIKTTANTALYAVCVTTGANVRVSASGYKGI